MKVKRIPSVVVKKYIQVDAKIDQLCEVQKSLKKKLRDYHAKGFESTELRFQESTTWKPDWRTLVAELTTKYMTPGEKRVYYRKLSKRFPRKAVAPTIVIIGKERKKKSAAAPVEG